MTKFKKVTKYITTDRYGKNHEFFDLAQAKEAEQIDRFSRFLLVDNKFSPNEIFVIYRAIRDHRDELLAILDEPIEPEDETLEPVE